MCRPPCGGRYVAFLASDAARNCGLLFYFWLLADQPVFALPIGRQRRRRLLSHGLLSGFLHRHYPCAANISHFCISAMAAFVRTHWPLARAGFFFAGAFFTSEGAPACVFGAAFF